MSTVELAFECRRLLDEGMVNNPAEITRRYRLSRARVTQILNVLRLPRPVLDCLAQLPPDSKAFCTERRLRRVLKLSTEAARLAAVRQVVGQGRAHHPQGHEGLRRGTTPLGPAY